MLNLMISGVKIDLIRYVYPILVPPIEADRYTMLAPPDIAVMKLSAIIRTVMAMKTGVVLA